MLHVSLLIKPASGMCNMKCDYCFYCDEIEKRKQASYGMMSEQTLKNVIRKGINFAERSCAIAFQGGEPTLCGIKFYKQVIMLVNHYNRKKIDISYSLQTNGYGITEEWCSFFKENHFLIGLSIDGTEYTHDKYRHNPGGSGTYHRVLETAKMFDRFKVDYNILTVVNKETGDNIEQIYRNYKSNDWKYLQFIACLDPLDSPRGEKNYSLIPDNYGKFMIKLFDLWYKDWKRGKQPYIRQFENFISILLGYPPESCDQRGTCGIQNVVEADGGVYPCDFYALDEYYLGNLNQNTMQDIQRKREEIQFCRRSYNHCSECRDCKWFHLCRGGCYRNRDDAGRNYFCEGYRIFFEKCYSRMEEIARSVTLN